MFKLKALEKTWTRLERDQARLQGAVQPRERWGATLTFVDGRLFLIGGFSGHSKLRGDTEGGFLNEIMEFSLSRLTWRQVYAKGALLKARSNHCATVIGEK